MSPVGGGYIGEYTTVDGSEIRRSPVDIVNIRFFIHPKWLFGISSINNMYSYVLHFIRIPINNQAAYFIMECQGLITAHLSRLTSFVRFQ